MIGRINGFLKAVWRNHRRQLDRPRFLTYTVTFGCNARCIMCDSWKMSTEGDLSLKEIEAIFRQLPEMDAVRLTGGEPFVRTDFLDITRLAVKYLNPGFVHVTSNGFLTNRVIEFCENRPRKTPLDMLISIDGVGDKHNSIRGNNTAYQSCLKTIAALAPRRKELNLALAVNQTVVDAEGVEQYRRLRDVLQEYGVRNHVVMAYDASATYNLERDIEVAPSEIGQFTTFGEFTSEHIEELLNEIEADLPNYPFWQRLSKRYYVRGIRNRLLGGTGVPNPKCVALNSHLRIFPNGDIPTCQFNSKAIGNLRSQSFEEVWNSALAAAQRRWVHGCPGCWAECEVLPNAIYTGDLLLQTVIPGPANSNGSRPRPLANSSQPEDPPAELVQLG